MATSSKPAKRISLAGLVLSLIFFVITWLLGQWSGFFAIFAVSWFIFTAGLIWFVLTVQFYQRSLAEQEKLDMSLLATSGDESTIFQTEGERDRLFAVSAKRLVVFEKWFMPIFSVVIAVCQMGLGVYLFRFLRGVDFSATKQPLICAVCLAAVAFISFLTSRYATGMSAASTNRWKELRAGGSSFLAVAVLCFALATGLALVNFKSYVVLSVINYLIPVLLIVLGVETSLNVILDIYRPRIKGQYSRSAFDSRLLGIINEPGSIFRTVASAIDYQFGFKVSQTWFYRMFEKAVVPLILFTVLVLYLFSGILIIAPNEQAIIERFGNPIEMSGQVRIAEPGLTFKWPWPIDISYKYPVKKIMELYIGFVPEIDEETGQIVRHPLLWGKEHYLEEYSVVVASSYGADSTDGIVPVSLVKANIPVQYRVKDIYSYLYNHKEPDKLLESICYRELAKFAASSTIEVDEGALEDSLLGAGRAKAKNILTERIQSAADKAELGVEIVFLGLQGIHPPPEVAADYQKVIGAVQEKQAIILNSQAYRNRVLSNLTGSVRQADALYSLAGQYQQMKKQDRSEALEQIKTRLDTAFTSAGGDIFKTLRIAQSYAFEKIEISRATGERFAGQLEAYNAAPEIYKQYQRLTVFEQALEYARKFVIAADPNDNQVFIIDVEEKLTPSLYELTGFEEPVEK